MSQMEIERVLSQIRAISAQTKPAAAGTAPGEASGPTFASLLKQGINDVNATQQTASALATAFERGTPGVELPQVMLEMQKATVSFRALAEVRNRLVNVYQEIMNMQI